MNDTSSEIRQTLAYVIGVGLYLLIAFAIEKVGLPREYVIAWTALFGLWLIGGTIRRQATTSPSRYFFAGRNARSTVAALAIAASLCGPYLLTDGIGFWFNAPGSFIAVTGSVALGLTISALLVSRPFRQSGATNAVNLVGTRFHNVYPARLLAVGVAVTCFGLMISGISAASEITGWFFRLNSWQAYSVVSLAVVLIAITGGAATQLRFAALAAITLIVAATLAMLQPSVELAGLPFGQLTFGAGALVPVGELEQELTSIGVPLLREQLFDQSLMANWEGNSIIIAAILMAAGVAVLPSVLQNFATARSGERAVAAGTRSAFFAGLAVISVIALLSYSVFDLYEGIFGLNIGDIGSQAGHLVAWGKASPDLVRLCGVAVSNTAEAIAACGNLEDYTLSTPDLTINGRLMLSAAPDFLGQPFAFTAFLSLAVILVLVAFSGAAAIGLAGSLVSGFYAIRLGHMISFRMFLIRLLVIVSVALAAFAASQRQTDNALLAIGMLGLHAATVFPALVATLFWQRVTAHGLAAGIATGFVITALFWTFGVFGPDFTMATGDEFTLPLPGLSNSLPPELTGIIGLVIGAIVLVATSLATRPRRDMLKDRGFLEMLRESDGEVAITKNRF